MSDVNFEIISPQELSTTLAVSPVTASLNIEIINPPQEIDTSISFASTQFEIDIQLPQIPSISLEMAIPSTGEPVFKGDGETAIVLDGENITGIQFPGEAIEFLYTDGVLTGVKKRGKTLTFIRDSSNKIIGWEVM